MINGTSFIVIGRVLQIALSLVSVRVMTTMLTTVEVGNYYLIFTISSFFSLAFLNPIGIYVNRKTHSWVKEQTIYSRLFTYNFYLGAVCLLTLPLVYLLCTYVGIGSNIPRGQLMLFVMVGLFCTTWNQVLIPMLNMLHYRRGFVLFSTLTLAVGLLLSITAVYWFVTPTAIAWLAGQATAQALITACAFVYFRRVIKGRLDIANIGLSIDRANLIEIFRFILPLGITAFMLWFQGQSYRIIVEQRASLELLGMIALGLGIASNIAAAVESLIQQLYLPLFYSEISSADQNARTLAWNRMAQVTMPIFVALAIFVSCLSPFLMDILANGKFAGAWIFIAFGAWIEFCRMTTGLLSGIAHAEMQTKYLVKSYLVGGLCSATGVWLATGFPQARLLVPAALLVSGGAAMGVMYVEMRKLMSTKVGIRNIRRSIVWSMPFALALPFAVFERQIIMSLIMLVITGSYFLFTQYRLARPLLISGERS